MRRGHSGPFWVLFSFLSILAARVLEPAGRQRIGRVLEATSPDIVVSVMPLVNLGIARANLATERRVPFLTVMIDFVETARGTWFQHPSQHLICGTPKAAAQAIRRGIPASQIYSLPGVLVSSQFDAPPAPEALATLRQSLLLPDSWPIGLMLFGGCGVSRMEAYARAIETADLPLQMIYVCGDNPGMVQRVSAIKGARPKAVLGYVENVASLMRLSSLVVSKPGPGSVAEAARIRVPMLVELNRHTLAHERYNARWVIDESVGATFRSPAHLVTCVRSVLATLDGGQTRRWPEPIDGSQSSLNQACRIIEKLCSRYRLPEGAG